MSFRDYFKKDFETGEESIYKTLKTHYYRERCEDIEAEIIDMIEKVEMGKIINVDDERKEVFYKTKDYEAIITLVEHRFKETSVDMIVSVTNIIPFLKPKKIIERLYKYLDTKLTYIGSSLFGKKI
jgi:hypothetical protein